MKMYVPTEERSSFSRLIIPSGREFPRAPSLGEVFHLEFDMPETHTVNPWYASGTYSFDGFRWRRLNDGTRQRRSEPVGAQHVGIEKASSPLELPTSRDGARLTAGAITPSHRKASISGAISMCLSSETDVDVWAVVFRAEKLVGGCAASVRAGKLTPLSVTFFDIPFTIDPVTYIVRLAADRPTIVSVNQGTQQSFDGGLQTAFTLEENV